MGRSILAVLIFAGLMAEGVASAAGPSTTKSAKNQSRAKLRVKDIVGRPTRPSKHAPILL